MKFKLEIDCGNAAFGDNMHDTIAEVYRVLRLAAFDLRTNGFSEKTLRDVNGNTIGKAWFEGKRDV